jgi:hypothetical protein
MNVTATINGTDAIAIDLSIDLVTHAEVRSAGLIVIFPNPVEDRLTIIADRDLKNLKVMASDGREINNLQTETDGERSVVDVTRLSGGLYILFIPSKTGISAVKFIKQ